MEVLESVYMVVKMSHSKNVGNFHFRSAEMRNLSLLGFAGGHCEHVLTACLFRGNLFVLDLCFV